MGIKTYGYGMIQRLTDADYRVDAVTGAKALVGAWLCRRLDDGMVIRRRITETEAYCGEEDAACHAHKGRTPRTDVMYSPGGCAYIYLCYGMHEMLNVVSSPPRRALASPTPPRATSAANGGLRSFNNFFADASETVGGIP